MRSLRSSQISTHLGGVDISEPRPAPPAASSLVPPTEQQDRRSLMEYYSADEVTV